MWPPIGLIPWFSKTEGNTYATLLHQPFLFNGKPTHAQEVALTRTDAVFSIIFMVLFLCRNQSSRIDLKIYEEFIMLKLQNHETPNIAFDLF